MDHNNLNDLVEGTINIVDNLKDVSYLVTKVRDNHLITDVSVNLDIKENPLFKVRDPENEVSVVKTV